MAKMKSRRQESNPVSDPRSEELRQRILEQQKQMQIEKEIRCLEELQDQARNNRFYFFPLAIGTLAILILVLYVVIKGHCFIDMPLFVILAVIAICLMKDLFVKNQKLCDRISERLGERGLN